MLNSQYKSWLQPGEVFLLLASVLEVNSMLAIFADSRSRYMDDLAIQHGDVLTKKVEPNIRCV